MESFSVFIKLSAFEAEHCYIDKFVTRQPTAKAVSFFKMYESDFW